MVEKVSPGPYLELFSRETEPRAGWDYWGDESLGTAEMPTRDDAPLLNTTSEVLEEVPAISGGGLSNDR